MAGGVGTVKPSLLALIICLMNSCCIQIFYNFYGKCSNTIVSHFFLNERWNPVLT